MNAPTVRPFVFSCDAHIAEPGDLFTSKLPAHLQQWALHPGPAEEKYRVTMMGDNVALNVARQSGSESPTIRIRIRDCDVAIVFLLFVAGKRYV
jgi:hypothetical protein